MEVPYIPRDFFTTTSKNKSSISGSTSTSRSSCYSIYCGSHLYIMKECKRFVTFNICGVRRILERCSWVNPKSLSAMFDALSADVICFQETKIQSQQITRSLVQVPHFNSFHTTSTSKRGYSGVSFYISDKIRVFTAEEGLTGWLSPKPGTKPYRLRPQAIKELYPDINSKEGLEIDNQGRVIILNLGSTYVIGVYCPADSTGKMTEYRNNFFKLLDFKIKALSKQFNVIVMGDFNVVCDLNDSAKALDDLTITSKDQWISDSIPRSIVYNWITNLKFMDTTRSKHPDMGGMYTCWDISKNQRPANYGSRIDLILIYGEQLECVSSEIMPELDGSDHCPVYADIILDVEPQLSVNLPLLSRKYADIWAKDIKLYFQKRI